MSRVSVCFFVLFVFSIALFGDCENNTITPAECDAENIKPGSDETKLSRLEKTLKKIPILGKNPLKKNSLQSKSEGTFSNILGVFKKYVRAIYPGTRWCGDGDIARDENDLGFFKKTDACCRNHDNCHHDIIAGSTEANLKNNGIFTRSACSCDFEFYKCLKEANNIIASNIGITYFNILKPQCYNCTCPTGECDPKTGKDCMDQCIKYHWVNNEKF